MNFKNIIKIVGLEDSLIMFIYLNRIGSSKGKRTIVEKARNILLKSGLPKNLCTKVVNTTNYVVNRSPSQANQRKTPEELFS